MVSNKNEYIFDAAEPIEFQKGINKISYKKIIDGFSYCDGTVIVCDPWSRAVAGDIYTYDDKFNIRLTDSSNACIFRIIIVLNVETGKTKWEQSINSYLKPLLIKNFLFTISDQGYLYVLDKDNGHIVRITKLYDNSNVKKKKRLKPIGFISNGKEIYLSTNQGKLLIINLENGKVIEILNITRNRISRPIVRNGNFYLIKDNSIIRLN